MLLDQFQINLSPPPVISNRHYHVAYQLFCANPRGILEATERRKASANRPGWHRIVRISGDRASSRELNSVNQN